MSKMEIKMEGATCAFLVMQVGVGLRFCAEPATAYNAVNLAVLPVCDKHVGDE